MFHGNNKKVVIIVFKIDFIIIIQFVFCKDMYCFIKI